VYIDIGILYLYMILPLELINRILIYRPIHPIAVLIQEKYKEYYTEEEFTYRWDLYDFTIYTHDNMSFSEWILSNNCIREI
jgi:hypothetical protein